MLKPSVLLRARWFGCADLGARTLPEETRNRVLVWLNKKEYSRRSDEIRAVRLESQFRSQGLPCKGHLYLVVDGVADGLPNQSHMRLRKRRSPNVDL